ncbi:MAG: TIGR04283 family arsenosugar biosynthesis glycosyltransferase [Vicinamibacterales bacterium]|nr:TIGR04283 family arsenosugar biosynthesis glycosyltransferase [Vicinamibacterales bacterium]
MPPPAISVIVPVLHDGPALGRLLHVLPAAPDCEVIVVDGGSDPAVDAACALRPDVRLIRAPAGRARQMNAGAATGTGHWLLFLHADSTLPQGWIPAITGGGPPDTIGGWFRFALDDRGWQARVLERLVAWRVAAFSLPYGDQGFFVRRDVFAAMGGFRDMPLMEDVEFARRLVRQGPVRRSPLPLLTSARRWRRDGWFRRSAGNASLLCLYFLGVNPARLARLYGRRSP